MKIGRICVFVTLASGFISSGSYGLSLKEAIEQTVRTNPEVRAVINERESRGYEVRQARAAYLPQVFIDAGIGRETRTAPATDDLEAEETRREFGLQARQTLFDGFSSQAEVGRQKARQQSASHEAQATAERVALKTAASYLDVLRYSKLLDLTRATLWEHQNIYDQMKLRSDKGVGSKADLEQISARLSLANANMIVAQNNLADAQANFFRVTGLYPNLENMTMPEAVGQLPVSRDEGIAKAIKRHPTLMSANADVGAAKQQYRAAASGYWPTFTLEADKRWDENVGTIVGEDEDLIIALRMNYNLYRGGADKARRGQTAYLMEEAKDIRNNTRRQVIESFHLAWNAWDAVAAQIEFLEQHVQSASNTKVAYAQQFNIGRRTLLDLLNTETEVVESERALINARYDHIYTRYRILNALGELLSAFNVATE
ncbi:TolC family outer membrane protein [Teredinibacter waterburyi]|uniref:TolC family outer membrane protein n=1 Tax=Teredinibacter waterburyi TaxID=1500538 RepID=UPI00165FA5F6|nr:TolC family outer membrane protein [Teredinibacter waterburyi]